MTDIQPNLLYGTHIGEHSFEPENIIREIQENCIDRGMNFVTIRTRREQIPQEVFLQWAKFLADNEIYFIFLYTVQNAPPGRSSQFDPETVAEMKRIAGKYFLGDMLGETGSSYACKMPGYFVGNHGAMPEQNVPDAQTAKTHYLQQMKVFMDVEKQLGMDGIATVEATMLTRYNLEAGVNLPIGEIMCGDPEAIIAGLRGAAKAYALPLWGTYVAHEWYSGFRHEDMLKRKRLELVYKYCYLSGSGILCLESGDDLIESYGVRMESDSPVSTQAHQFVDEFAQFVRTDRRPSGGPKVKVGFVHGNLDAWNGGWGGSSQWSQFSGEQWGSSTAEWSWRIVNDLEKKSKWWERDNYGSCDVSAQPAYGSYDIIPAEAPAEVLRQYDCLIYAGWNTMTEEQLQKLEDYVNNGGTLLMAAAHLNTSSVRGGPYEPVRNGDLSRLFGCTLLPGCERSNLGIKFNEESHVPGLLYPYAPGRTCDPIYANGYVSYAKVAPRDCCVMAALEDSFLNTGHPGTPVVLEHNLGKGHAILLTSLDYPGSGAVYPLYRCIVRALCNASANAASVQVLSSDALRYSVWEDGTIYLLNTDFDIPIHVEIRSISGEPITLTLQPLELKKIRS